MKKRQAIQEGLAEYDDLFDHAAEIAEELRREAELYDYFEDTEKEEFPNGHLSSLYEDDNFIIFVEDEDFGF